MEFLTIKPTPGHFYNNFFKIIYTRICLLEQQTYSLVGNKTQVDIEEKSLFILIVSLYNVQIRGKKRRNQK